MGPTLANLKTGESAIIEGFTDEDISLRLLEMGCLPGSEVTLCTTAPLGDPICIFVSGYHLSLRLNEADTVLIKNK